MKNIQADIWRDLGGIWSDKYWNLEQKRGRQFVDYFKDLGIESVFEVGCNSGRNLYYINKHMDLDKIAGVEISSHAAAEAKRNVSRATITEGNLHDMDLEEKFDVVFTGGVLMHVPPPDVKGVIEKMISKANKYVVHMEPVGKDIVKQGPKEFNPLKECKLIKCLHNIPRIYKELGMDQRLDIRHKKDVEPFIVCKL